MSVTTELMCGKTNARAILAISQCLPSADVEYPREPTLKLFYELSSTIKRAGLKFLDGSAEGKLYKIYFDFSVTVNGRDLEVKRQVKVVEGTEIILQSTSNALFQIVDGKTLKILKNGKKQRFIPSRNDKNVKINNKTQK